MTADERRARAEERRAALELQRREQRLARELTRRLAAIALRRRLEAARERGETMAARRTPRARAVYELTARWRREHPVGVRAQQLVYAAIRAGRLQRPDQCKTCGRATRLHGHHDDYSKPLEVVWLCSSCHRLAHHPRVAAKAEPNKSRARSPRDATDEEAA